MSLFPDLAPVAAPAGIDLRCADLFDVLADVRGAQLVHADPPWDYNQNPGGANPDTAGIFATMTDDDITRALDLAYDCALPGARLVCWATWPKLLEYLTSGGAGPRWRYVTGGAWLKTPHSGVGYHWRGHTEPVLVYVKNGTPYTDTREMLANGYASKPEQHSRKPMDWQRQMLRKWTQPGALVLDAWAGLAPLAGACKLECRRYVGAEIDAERHGLALSLLRDV
jgi:hypothetical protein